MSEKAGRIELIVGPMFGGKSTELLRRLRRYQIAQKQVIAIKSAKDTRYSEAPVICTHAQEQFKEVLIAGELSSIDVSAYEVIGVDEGQFYPDLDTACERWANLGKLVIVSMLDGTYERLPFPNLCLARLLPLCESIVKLNAVCRCGADAAFTEKTSSAPVDGNGELVGGAESYRSACRKCHTK